jgi:uncharacterized protein (DUF427 family)
MSIMDSVRKALGHGSLEAVQLVRASWQGVVLAESDATVVVEGNHYFPRESVDSRYLRESDTHSVCPWKGTASYLDVVLEGGKVNRDAAWYYPDPKPAVTSIEGRVAFWHGVIVKPVAKDQAPA